MQINGFDIQEKAFSDAIGDTFVAHAEDGAESVYLKVLHKEYCSDEALVRCFQACLKQVKTDDVMCPKLLSSGTQDDQPYAVFEYFDLLPLAELLGGKSFLAIDKTLNLIESVAEAVQALHKNGKVHKHLNFHTVFANPQIDTIKIANPAFADFMLELISRKHRRLLEFLPYMTPGFIQEGKSSPEDDLYAIGVLFYELLVGQTPQDRQNLDQLLTGNRNGAIVPPSLKRLEIPDALDRIVFLALEAGPAAATDFSDFIAELIEVKPLINVISYDESTDVVAAQGNEDETDVETAQLFDEMEEESAPPTSSDKRPLFVEEGEHADAEIRGSNRESNVSKPVLDSESVDLMDPFANDDDLASSTINQTQSEIDHPSTVPEEQQEEDSFTEIDWLLQKEPAAQNELPAQKEPPAQEELAAQKEPPTQEEPNISRPAATEDNVASQETETESAEAGDIDSEVQSDPNQVVIDKPEELTEESVHVPTAAETSSPFPFPLLQHNEFDDRTMNPVIRRSLFRSQAKVLQSQTTPTAPISSSPPPEPGKKQLIPSIIPIIPMEDDPIGETGHNSQDDNSGDDEVQTEQLVQTETISTTQTIDLTQPLISGSSVWTALKILIITLIPLVTIYFLIIITFDAEFKQRIIGLKDWVIGAENQAELRPADGGEPGTATRPLQRPLLPSEIRRENANDKPSNNTVERAEPLAEKQVSKEPPTPVANVQRPAPASNAQTVQRAPQTASRKIQARPSATKRVALPRELVVRVTVRAENRPQLANVYVDGQLYGQTNAEGVLSLRDLDFGRAYLIKVESQGFAMWATERKFTKTTPSTIDVTLHSEGRSDLSDK